MNIPLKPKQGHWLEAQVAAGRFSSVAEAVEAAVARLQVQDSVDDAWAKPFIDEAIAALDRGEGKPWVEGEALREIHARHAARK